MPRNMSFFHTQPQVRDRSKTVTRRKGWGNLRPGDRFWAVAKGQGLKKGEHVERICLLECVSNHRVILGQMSASDPAQEGFPQLSVPEFVRMFCGHMGGDARQRLNRIEFKYVEE
jgi:hypothetical protein